MTRLPYFYFEAGSVILRPAENYKLSRMGSWCSRDGLHIHSAVMLSCRSAWDTQLAPQTFPKWSQCPGWTSPCGSYYDGKMYLSNVHSIPGTTQWDWWWGERRLGVLPLLGLRVGCLGFHGLTLYHWTENVRAGIKGQEGKSRIPQAVSHLGYLRLPKRGTSWAGRPAASNVFIRDGCLWNGTTAIKSFMSSINIAIKKATCQTLILLCRMWSFWMKPNTLVKGDSFCTTSFLRTGNMTDLCISILSILPN